MFEGGVQEQQHARVTSPVYFVNTTKIHKSIIILVNVLVLHFIDDRNYCSAQTHWMFGSLLIME